MRVAFVGQRTYFAACSMDAPAGGWTPEFVDFRAGERPDLLLADLERLRPHAVVVFRPEIIPPGVLHDLDALVIGFVTEPIPRRSGAAHPDLERRLSDLRAMDCGNFDRVVSFDPLIADTARDVTPIWRSLPLPVADGLYRPPAWRSATAPRTAFLGRSTEHREQLMAEAKHRFDVLHIAHGVDGAALADLLDSVDVLLNLHNEPYPSFENRVSLGLAAGLLVASEELSPTHGLEPGLDFVQVADRHDVTAFVHAVRTHPQAFTAMRVRGRQKAERFRASRAWPDLLADARRDVAAFGSARAASASALA